MRDAAIQWQRRRDAELQAVFKRQVDSLQMTCGAATIVRVRVAVVGISMIASVSILLVIGTAAAEPLGPGMPMPAIVLTDQHDVEASLDGKTRLVVFARDMDAGDIVEEALADNGAAVLADADAVFVSDIHRMPGIITKLFALPAMRKRPYRMLLDREGIATADLPAQEDKVTLIQLDQLEIKSVDYVDSATQLRAALLAAKPEAAQRP